MKPKSVTLVASPVEKNISKKIKLNSIPTSNEDSIMMDVHVDKDSLVSSKKMSLTQNNNQNVQSLNISNSPATLRDRQSYGLIRFPSNYSGPLIIMLLSTDENLRNTHPVYIRKILIKNFPGIISVRPADSEQIKITFNSSKNANDCLLSNTLALIRYILSSLLYCFGVICLDECVSEKDF